jgi:hypothetical protein
MIADLIARLEKAEGPSRELDAEIFAHIGLTELQESHCRSWCRMAGRTDLTRERYIDAWAPAYTASIDAALTLVPDGMWWLIGAGRIRQREPLYGAQIMRHDPDPPYTSDVIAEGEHDAGAAVALCIAALRARLV